MKSYGVIFDMDGVLVNSYQAHYEAWLKLAAAHGLEFTERQFVETFGQINRKIIPRYWGHKVKDLDEVDRWGVEKEQYYRDILEENFPEIAGANDLIASLHKAGIRLAIGSSGPKENVQAGLKGLSNRHLFLAAVHGGEVAHGKPDPEVFILAAQRIGLHPKQCLVVEDALVGLQAARNAGMVAVAITGTIIGSINDSRNFVFSK